MVKNNDNTYSALADGVIMIYITNLEPISINEYSQVRINKYAQKVVET